MLHQASFAQSLSHTHSSVGLRAGSAGWGLEINARIQKQLYMRTVWQTLAPGRFEIYTNPEQTESYQAKGSFRSAGFLADWYPWTTPVRFSFGLFRNTSRFQIAKKTPQNQPSNRYSANFGQLAYFFGTGWAPRKSKRVTLSLDIGLLAQQPPQLTWNTDNQNRTPAQIEGLWSDRATLAIELEKYKILPFFMLGLNLKLY